MLLREELDDVIQDHRMPLDGRIELHFSSTPNTRAINGVASDAITHAITDENQSNSDPIVKWDSLENFDRQPEDKMDVELAQFASQLNSSSVTIPMSASWSGPATSTPHTGGGGSSVISPVTTPTQRPLPLGHTQGPVDGSLYATVAKSANQSKKSPTITFNLPNGDAMSEDGPHTISIDSGISGSTLSATHHGQQHSQIHQQTPHGPGHMHKSANESRYMNGTGGGGGGGGSSSGYPSPINVEVEVHHQPSRGGANPSSSLSSHMTRDSATNRPGIPPAEQEALDQLLKDMLLAVDSIPDFPTPTGTRPPLTSGPSPHSMHTSVMTEMQNSSPNSKASGAPVRRSSSVKLSPTIPRSLPPMSPKTTDSIDTRRKEANDYQVPEPPRRIHYHGPEGSAFPTFKMVTDFKSPWSPPSPPHSLKTALQPLPARLLTRPPPAPTAADDMEDEDDENVKPYHARTRCQPFSYGVTQSSPVLQRRRVLSESTAYVKENHPQKGGPDHSTPHQLHPHHSHHQPNPSISSRLAHDHNLNVDVNNDEAFSDRCSDLPSSSITCRIDSYSDPGGNLTWLQRQQMKLNKRRYKRDFTDRVFKEQALMAELKSLSKQQKAPSEDRESVSGPEMNSPCARPSVLKTKRLFEDLAHGVPVHRQGSDGESGLLRMADPLHSS